MYKKKSYGKKSFGKKKSFSKKRKQRSVRGYAAGRGGIRL